MNWVDREASGRLGQPACSTTPAAGRWRIWFKVSGHGEFVRYLTQMSYDQAYWQAATFLDRLVKHLFPGAYQTPIATARLDYYVGLAQWCTVTTLNSGVVHFKQLGTLGQETPADFCVLFNIFDHQEKLLGVYPPSKYECEYLSAEGIVTRTHQLWDLYLGPSARGKGPKICGWLIRYPKAEVVPVVTKTLKPSVYEENALNFFTWNGVGNLTWSTSSQCGYAQVEIPTTTQVQATCPPGYSMVTHPDGSFGCVLPTQPSPPINVPPVVPVFPRRSYVRPPTAVAVSVRGAPDALGQYQPMAIRSPLVPGISPSAPVPQPSQSPGTPVPPPPVNYQPYTYPQPSPPPLPPPPTPIPMCPSGYVWDPATGQCLPGPVPICTQYAWTIVVGGQPPQSSQLIFDSDALVKLSQMQKINPKVNVYGVRTDAAGNTMVVRVQ